MKLNIEVSRATIAKTARELQKETDRIKHLKQSELEGVTKSGFAHAQDLLDKAEYDGDIEQDYQLILIPDNGWKWEFLAYGPAVYPVEFGATKSNPKYWFFSGKGQKIALKAGGDRAYYTRHLRKETKTVELGKYGFSGFHGNSASKISAQTKTVDISDDDWWDRPIRKFKGGDTAKKYTNMLVPSQLDPSKKFRIASYTPIGNGSGMLEEIVKKKDSYITKGNKPNNVMQKTFEYMADEVNKL